MVDGADFLVPGSNFTRYVDIVEYPIAGASSLFFLGDDAVASKENQGSGANATGGASVTYHDGYASFSGTHTTITNYLQTSDADNASADVSRLAVYRRTVDGLRGVWGAYNGAGDGSAIYSGGGACGGGGALVTGALAINEMLADFLFQAVIIEGSVMRTYTGHDGRLVPGSAVAVTRAGSANTDRIGGGYAGVSAGSLDIHAVAKHPFAITAEEALQVYVYLRSRAEKIGDIVVL